MQKITIIANDELYKVLGQAGEALPGCGLYLAPVLNAEIIKDSDVIIADGAHLSGFEGGGAKFIVLTADGDFAPQPDMLVVKKPYRVQDVIELLQSVAAQNIATNESLAIGDFIFDVSARTLTKGMEKITLTEKEAELVLLLAQSTGEVSREEILRQVWGYEAGIDTHTIETHIYRIRQKLGKDDDFIGSSAVGYFVK